MLLQLKKYNVLLLLTILMLVAVSCHKGGEPEPAVEVQAYSVEETITPLLRDGDGDFEEEDEGDDSGGVISVVGGDDGEDDDGGGGSVVGGDDGEDDDGGGGTAGPKAGAGMPEGSSGASDIKQ